MDKLVVLGAGESGLGAAMLGKKMGMDVWVSDAGKIKPEYLKRLKTNYIPFEEATHSVDRILEADIIVKSPGIPKGSELIKELKANQKIVISEIEFASRFTQAKIVAITGSNGKTTTTSLVYHILSNAGLNVGLAGNIGNSFAQMVAENNYDYYVLELSSFQLDDIQTFKPYVAVLLNITADHLDQYGGRLEAYARSKFRITYNQDKEDYFVYNFDDEYVVELLKDINVNAKTIPFSIRQKLEEGGYATVDQMYIENESKWQMPISELALYGEHNVSNSLAAAVTANIFKISSAKIRESLANFKAVEHRLELVSKKGGVAYINDSKATNINAAYYALKSTDAPIIWIAGGQDKGNDYSELFELVDSKVKALICLGLDNQKLIGAFHDKVETIIETKAMSDAVHMAQALSEKGDTVLLSPACASFDLFDNYEHRGKLFKEEGQTIEEANAARWLRIPGLPIQLQTSTLASLVLLVYVA
ncbi:unnamed protein product, partial [Cyprideis torosa]